MWTKSLGLVGRTKHANISKASRSLSSGKGSCLICARRSLNDTGKKQPDESRLIWRSKTEISVVATRLTMLWISSPFTAEMGMTDCRERCVANEHISVSEIPVSDTERGLLKSCLHNLFRGSIYTFEDTPNRVVFQRDETA